MHPPDDILQSSSARRVSLRIRPDLQASKQRYQGRISWIVKEPLGLNYFRFKEEEYFILELLDGRRSLEAIQERFEAEFPPQKITLAELQQFVGSLHRSGLVIADAAGQGEQLRKRREEQGRRERIARWTNVLAIRFRGIDPERILAAIYPWIRWMFWPPVVLICCLLALSALLLLVVQFDVFVSRLPAFHQFFSPANVFWLLLAVGATKVFHEFGHGLSCRHFGGECHEMGVMFLVLTPCLYCNVSDSWMLPNKWRRAAIGFAGIYLEIVIAAIATFLWWFSEPGVLNHVALAVMFVCSVSTIMFNANPLLRYDGYYILSDLIEIPNLRQKSSQILIRKLGQWCLGIEPPPDPFLPERNQLFFALYSVASAVYRWVVVFAILWFLDRVFAPYRLQVLGQLIALAAVYGLLIVPLWKLVKFFQAPGRIEKVKTNRMFATLGLVAVVVAVVALAPLPHHVMCPLELRVAEATPVYVEIDGTLEEVRLRPGDVVQVAAGQPGPVLARMANLEVDLSIAELKGRYAQADARLQSLELQRNDEPALGIQIPPAKEALAAIDAQLANAQDDRARLLLRVPRSGTIFPPAEIHTEPAAQGRLSSWTGTPFDAKNQGCHLKTGELFCLVGDPGKMEAVLVIDQADVKFVHEGDRVEIKLDELPGETIHGVIEAVSRSDLKLSPENLSNKTGGELATTTGPSGSERPLSTSFQARVRLENVEDRLRIGFRGRAKIHGSRRTLATRLWRYLSQTFRFRR